jgi:multidrug resistance efflux pump
MPTPGWKAIWTMIWKPILAGSLLVAAAAAGLSYYWKLQQPRGELWMPGTVESQEVRLSSRVGGRVTKVLVKESQVVEAGEAILELEMPELDAERKQLEAQLASAKAALAKAEKGPREEEKAAAQADVAAAAARLARMRKGYRTEEQEQARKEEEAIVAEMQNAYQELTRERTLMNKGATTVEAYEAAAAKHNRLQAQAAAAGAKTKMMEAGYRPEEVAEAEAQLASFQAAFDLLEAGTRQEDIDAAAAKVAELEAQIAELDVRRAERTVYAPEKAVVEVIGVRPGDIAEPNAPLVRVLRADDLWVKAYISEVDLGHIALGKKVDVTIDTFPGKRFQGVVTYIASDSEFTPRNVQTIDERRHQVFGFKVRVDDPQGIFKSGMAAEVFLPLAPQTKGEPTAKTR